MLNWIFFLFSIPLTMGSYYMIILSLVNTFPSFFSNFSLFSLRYLGKKSVLYSTSLLVHLLSRGTRRLQIPEVSVHAHTTVCKPVSGCQHRESMAERSILCYGKKKGQETESPFKCTLSKTYSNN